MSKRGINSKFFNNSNIKKKNESKQQKEDKEEKSIEINSSYISGQNMNEINKKKEKIVNNESLSQDNDSEEKEDPLDIIKNLGKNNENSSSNRTIRFRNQRKISNNITETNTNTNADFLQRTERILKKRRRNSFKRVSTIDNNEEIIQFAEFPQQTIRQKLSHFFEANNRLFYIRIIVSVLNTLSFIYYVVCTYNTSLYKSLNYIDFFICFTVIIEHIITILLAHHVCKFLFSFESIINFFIEIPPYFSLMCSDYITNKFYRFINITRVFRLTKCYIILDIYQHGEKSVNSQILNIILSILLIIFTFAGVVQMFDLEDVLEELKIAYLPETKYYLEHRKQYHHYLYFIIVSLTTVGYGDITPKSIMSQLTMLVFVFFILAVIPSQTDELINLSNAQTIYERKEYISNPDIPFVVLMGNIELEILKSFCEEYFHSDHGQFYRHIVILTNQYPHKAFEYFLMEKENSKFIYYLQGDPMKKENLIRADILKAKSCIIFCDKNARDLSSEDQKEIFLALYVKKFYYMTTLDNLLTERQKNPKIIQSSSHINPKKLLKGNNFKIFLQLNKTESPIYYYGALQNHYKKFLAKDQLLIIENLKMNLLSKSCITPGIISLLYNLIISSSSGKMFGKNMPEWIREYTEGTQYEIYKFPAEGELLNFNFPQLAIEIFNKYHSLLIALEINYKGHSLIKLNPQTEENINEIIEKNIAKLDTKGKDDNNINTISNDSIAEEDENPNDKIKKLIKIRKSIKIYFYLISKDKEIIEELQKMDNTKIGISALKSRFRKSIAKINSSNYDEQRYGQNSTYRTLRSDFNKSPNGRTLRRAKTKFQSFDEENSESDESSSSEEEVDMKEIISEILNNIDKYEEKEKIINNYYTVEGLGNNYLNNDIKFPDIKDRRDIKDHVIICGMHSEIIHFILPLRAKYLTKKMLKWIVILSPNLPKDIQDILSIFPKIIYIQGDPLYPENLQKCNISTAEIAVILSNNFSTFLENGIEPNSNQDFSNENDSGNSQEDINKIKMEGQFLDSSTLFIYNSIKKINSSIKIITELLFTNNIEFLLSSKYLNKLNTDKKNSSNNDFNKNDGNRMNYKISPNYELTPVFATGEIYLPSLGDKILAQMFYNTNLLTIINLILEGDKYIMKSKEKKLNDIFKLTGSNLFMIPCEVKNESFGELFKRMLNKNGILCIALYRKNLVDNFYYVYTNPKKTTLIKETDYIFVLAGTQNIDKYYEQNEAKIVNINEKNKENDFNKINKRSDKKKPTLVKMLQDSIKMQYLQLRKNKNINDNSFNKEENLLSLDNINMNFINNINEERLLYRNSSELNEKQRHSIFFNIANYEEAKSKKNYKEVEELQKQVNKTMEKLKKLNINFNDFETDIDSHIKNEIKSEF